tara:strand:- start:1520 stop:1759 length:240 start_codon:yes stop_codon:yes gene_type:complete
MNDLTTRLRCGAPTSVDISTHLKKYQALCDEAADEIIRLTAEVERLRTRVEFMHNEIERMRRHLSSASGPILGSEEPKT